MTAIEFNFEYRLNGKEDTTFFVVANETQTEREKENESSFFRRENSTRDQCTICQKRQQNAHNLKRNGDTRITRDQVTTPL